VSSELSDHSNPPCLYNVYSLATCFATALRDKLLRKLRSVTAPQSWIGNWPLCYKTNFSWNIAISIEVLEEVLSFYDYFVLCNYPVSFLEHKKFMI